MDRLIPHIERVIQAEIDKASRENALEPKRPKERVAMTDQKAILDLHIGRILADQVEFYEDRERRPR